MTTDPKGRLIASDQYGKLYRITPTDKGTVNVEEIELKIGFAQGLLCAFDSLYVVSYGIDTKTKKGKNKLQPNVLEMGDMPPGKSGSRHG